MPVAPFATFPPRGLPSLFVFGRRGRAAKRDTARLGASTQAGRIIRQARSEYLPQGGGFAAASPRQKLQSLACGGGWIDHLLHCGDFGRRKTADLGMLANDRLVFGEVHAEGFIIGNITFDPLDVGAKLAQHIVRFRRGLAQLFPLESSDLWGCHVQ
jgi:hypothetical protein